MLTPAPSPTEVTKLMFWWFRNFVKFFIFLCNMLSCCRGFICQVCWRIWGNTALYWHETNWCIPIVVWRLKVIWCVISHVCLITFSFIGYMVEGQMKRWVGMYISRGQLWLIFKPSPKLSEGSASLLIPIPAMHPKSGQVSPAICYITNFLLV